MNLQSLDLSSLTRSAPDPEAASEVGGASRPFLIVMAIVAMLGGIYYAFIAAPMYVSESRFTIRSQQAAAPTSILAGLIGQETGLADIVSVQDHIYSQEMAEALDQQFHLRQAYSKPRADLFRWLPPRASDEAFLRFYRRMVIVKLDREASIIQVDVRSFDRDSARPLAVAILQRTEDFVDGMTQRVRSETMRAAQGELDRARREAEQARLAVGQFRGATSSVNPSVTGAQVQGGQSSLESQAAAVQAELASALTFNRPDSPVVRQLNAKLAAIRAQAARLRAEQGAGGGGAQVTTYEALIVQRDNAERKLATAMTAFDSARALAQQREKYVVRVVNPSQPDKPTAPKRIRDFLTIMIFALAGFAIISLAIAGIRDHRGV